MTQTPFIIAFINGALQIAYHHSVKSITVTNTFLVLSGFPVFLNIIPKPPQNNNTIIIIFLFLYFPQTRQYSESEKILIRNMGRSSWMTRVDNQENEDGESYNNCMWKRFIYALDYHHWHYNNVRKKLLHKILHDGRKHDKNKAKLIHNDPGEEHRLLQDQESHLQVDQSQKKPGLNNKRSLRARIKALIVEQNQEVKNNKQQRAGIYYKQPKNQQTYSIHHLEPTDDDHDWKNPIFILPGSPNKDSKTLQDKEEVAKKQINKDKDVLELFKVNKELFLKFLQDSEKSSKKKTRLKKSGSFPLYGSKRGDYKPLKLKDKQNEVWSKVERLEDDNNQAPNLAMPKYAKDLLESLADEEDNRILNRASTLDFRCKATELEKEEDNEVHTPVKEVAEIEGKNDELQRDRNGIPKSLFFHKRSSSLNESLDRYSRLYDHSFGKEVELKPSRSLKVTNERVIPSIPFRRIRSLSNVETSYFLQLDQLLGSAAFSDHPIRTAEESSSINVTNEGEENPEIQEKARNHDGFLSANTDDEIDELKLVRGNSYKEQGIICSEVASNDTIVHSHLDSSPETCFQEEILIPEDDQMSKGSEYTSNHANENDFAINSSDSSCADSISSQKFTNVEKACKHSHQSYTMDDPDFCYIMEILECSVFTQNFFQGAWYTSEQPLNPSVFEEVEACWHQEFQSAREEISLFFHHQMLFDLVNEVLAQIYDRSFPYYPAALSSCCRIRPLPTGKHIIEEVFSGMSSLLNLKPGANQSVDSIVARDLEKDYGWMNLQMESEYVALELESILFYEFLDELLNP